MYETKVPGTRYTVALVNEKGQWYIQIKLDDVVESAVPVKDLSERGILENIRTVVSDVNLFINDFLIDQITKKITNEAQILLTEVAATASKATVQTQTEISAVEETIIQIVKRIETVEERIERLEQALEHRD
ncbi:MAG: hypothetical protein ACTSYV_02640 [Candidatus Heimdallarchaeaceae archaeon]